MIQYLYAVLQDDDFDNKENENDPLYMPPKMGKRSLSPFNHGESSSRKSPFCQQSSSPLSPLNSDTSDPLYMSLKTGKRSLSPFNFSLGGERSSGKSLFFEQPSSPLSTSVHEANAASPLMSPTNHHCVCDCKTQIQEMKEVSSA